MRTGLSEKVREVARREYIEPALRAGTEVVIPVGELQHKLRQEGFPSGHVRQICTSLESNIFTRQYELVRETPPGQPEKVSTSFRFRFAKAPLSKRGGVPKRHEDDSLLALVGVLQGAVREGAVAFVRELRQDSERQG